MVHGAVPTYALRVEPDRDDELLLRLPHLRLRNRRRFGALAALVVTSLALTWDLAGLLPFLGSLDSPELSQPLVGFGLFVGAWVAAVAFFAWTLGRTASRAR